MSRVGGGVVARKEGTIVDMRVEVKLGVFGDVIMSFCSSTALVQSSRSHYTRVDRYEYTYVHPHSKRHAELLKHPTIITI